MRAGVLCRLLVPTARTGAALPAATAAALGAAAFAVTADHAGASAETTIVPLRMAAVVAGLGAGFVVDDPAETSVASLPTPLFARRLVRVALLAPLLALWWMVLSVWAATLSPELPHHALTLEAAAVVMLSLGAAAGAGRFMPPAHSGVAGAGVVLVLAAIAVFPSEGPLLFLPGPEDPRWEASHLRWAALAGAGAGVFVAASWDPARR